jgi:LysM domain
MKRTVLRAYVGVALLTATAIPLARAQEGEVPTPESAADTPATAEEVTSPGSTSVTTTSQGVVGWGLPQPGFDPNAHLGSSSRAKLDINEPDTFDLDDNGGRAQTVYGSTDAAGVFHSSGGGASGMYTVKAGDTLSKIAEQAFGQRLMWPKLWSLNPQIQNPHWIYPGDQVMLSPGTANQRHQSRTLGAGAPIGRPRLVHRQTVFLRRLGYIDDPANGVLGEVVGAREAVQLIAQEQNVYLELRSEASLQEGQDLTIFNAVRNPPKVRGARRPPGKLVSILGTARVEYWNPKTRVARARVLEAIDVIERGAKVGNVGREHVVIAPNAAKKNVAARVLTSMYPRELMGQNDVLFIDRGTEDGLTEGNRLFVIRRGDTWRRTLSSSSSEASSSINVQSDERVEIRRTPLHGDEQNFPEEIVAELRVVKAHRYSSLVAVIHSRVELEPGDRAVARAGF